MALKVEQLNAAFDRVDEQLNNMELKKKVSKPEEEEEEVRIPNFEEGVDSRHRESSHKSKSNKKNHHHVANDLITPVEAKDVAGPNNAYTIQQRAPSWVRNNHDIFCYRLL